MGKLSELVQRLEPTNRKDFTARIKPAILGELLELRRQYHAGELQSHLNVRAIYRAIAPALGVPVSDCTFRRWFSEGVHDVKETRQPSLKPQGKQRRKSTGKAPRKTR